MRMVWLGAAAAVGAFLLMQAPSPASAQNGSFRGSCRNVISLGNGAISAECLNGAGRYRSSTIAAGQCQGDIGNQNGMLACNGAMASGGAYVPDPARRSDNRGYNNNGYGGGFGGGGGDRYRGNDRYDDRYGDRDDDRRGDGGYGGRDRDRDDRFQSRGGVVSGSYQNSCRYGETLQGGYLTAECNDGRGRYRQSTIQYTRCNSDISNQNGMLACAGAVATVGAYGR